MAEGVEVEFLQAQVEELRERLENLGIVGSPRGQSNDVSLVAGIKEWTGESKGKPVQEFLAQIETMAKVSGWSSQDKGKEIEYKQGFRRQVKPWEHPPSRRPSGLQCFNCHEYGHVRRDCAKVNRAFMHPNGHSSTLGSPASNFQASQS
jgi:hypothetical protein